MRILLVGNYPLDNQRSMSRYGETLLSQMARRGHVVEIICPGVVFGGIFRSPGVRKWLGYVDKYLIFPLRLRSRCARFDVVHVCDHSNAVYLEHTAGRPSSITCHDLFAIASASGWYQRKISWTGRLQQQWIRKHLRRARHVVCVSQHTADEFAGLVGGEAVLTVIPNALGLSGGRTTEQSVEQVRNSLGLCAGDEYLLHVGGNHWYKNRMGVLRIYRALYDELQKSGLPALRLVMAGEAMTTEMRAFVNESDLRGQVIGVQNPPDETLRALYSGATALLFPSLCEGFGWPIIEAQSCGCPVITSNRSPMTEIAGEPAVFVEPEDEQAAALEIAAHLRRLPLLREASLENVSRFEPARIALQYESFFASVAGCLTLDAAPSRGDLAQEDKSGNL